MIVGKPVLTASDEETTVTATVEVERRDRSYPPTLWFTFPSKVGRFVTERADGFVTSLLPLAMWNRESLTVHADISCRLARGVREYQQFQCGWKPKMFGEVAVRCDAQVQRDPRGTAGAVGSAFSGGVDSFHTLWAHLAANEPLAPYRITHCLMINGFDPDADLANAGSFARIQSLYERLAARLGIELIAVRTNLLQFLGAEIQKQAFAAFVTSPALVLGPLFSCYFVPSSYRFSELGPFPDGSHPMFDHLLATEALETIHDCGHLTRVEKTLDIAAWPETYDLLRVCVNTTGVQPGRAAIANCCTCEKCVRTMVTLELAGALARYRCFAHPLTRRSLRRMDYGYPGTRVFAEEIIAFATSRRRWRVARDLRHAIRLGVLFRNPVRALMLASLRQEQRVPWWGRFMQRIKRLVKRTGAGGGWLYWVPP
jgi:hypothetical protein